MSGGPVNIQSKSILLYVGSRSVDDLCSLENGFVVESLPDPASVASVEKRPDIILMDPFGSGSLPKDQNRVAKQWIQDFESKSFRFKPALFLILDSVPGALFDLESRLDLLEGGVDEIISWPISSRELRVKADIYIEKNNIEQKQYSGEQALAKAFQYLDRFKRELKVLKKELVEEKSSLNSALKQIQEMTGERQRLKTRQAALSENLDQNMDGFGKILSTLIRTRVEVNRNHGGRVWRIADFIAKELGFDEKKLEDLRKAAMLHEVGLLFMSGQPEQDQKKTGEKLSCDNGVDKKYEPTVYDKNLMVQYPVKGADLLSLCPGFENAAQMIQSLNEWSDGTGYPDGLKRRYIPMASRILAGADELDRLKDNEDIQSQEDLLARLEDLAGTRLDPVIVGWLGKYVVLHMETKDFRVRGVGIEQLEPGMQICTALFTATGTKLFSVNTILTREAIDKIIQYNREYPVDETVYIKA